MFEALDNPVFLVLWTAANVLGLLLLLTAVFKARQARWMYILLFAWAAWTNYSTAQNDPQAYLEYADLTWSDTYAAIIRGPFAARIVHYVELVALCQALIVLGLLLKGIITRVACLGGIVFLLAITPFGVGSGFPSPLLMAAGLFLVMRKESRRWPWLAEQVIPVEAVVEDEAVEG